MIQIDSHTTKKYKMALINNFMSLILFIFYVTNPIVKNKFRRHHGIEKDRIRFILSTYLTPSSQNDSHLPMVIISSMHTKNKIQKV